MRQQLIVVLYVDDKLVTSRANINRLFRSLEDFSQDNSEIF